MPLAENPASGSVVRRWFEFCRRRIPGFVATWGERSPTGRLATDSVAAPWTVVNSNDKRRARLEAIRHVLDAFRYDDRDDEIVGPADPRVFRPAAALLSGGTDD